MTKKSRNLTISIGLMGLFVVIIVGIGANRSASIMFKNSDEVKVAAESYREKFGNWPTSENQIYLPEEILDKTGEVMPIDNDTLFSEGNLENLDDSYTDFAIILDGPNKGEVIFVGNKGRGISTLDGKAHYSREINVDRRILSQPTIPVPVRHISR